MEEDEEEEDIACNLQFLYSVSSLKSKTKRCTANIIILSLISSATYAKYYMYCCLMNGGISNHNEPVLLANSHAIRVSQKRLGINVWSGIITYYLFKL